MRKTFIYLGPSMSLSEAQSIFKAEYLPPICRGDLAELPEDANVVGIIDGEFFQSLAVSTKEIVPLLDRGVQVFGAASIGALRAAETHIYGTVGVGEIFAMFRDGVLDGDDEVALAYERHSYRKLSEPLINIRRALELALAAKVIDELQMKSLIQKMKSLYFPDRSVEILQSYCPSLVEFFRRTAMPDVKRDDARELLFTIKRME